MHAASVKDGVRFTMIGIRPSLRALRASRATLEHARQTRRSTERSQASPRKFQSMSSLAGGVDACLIATTAKGSSYSPTPNRDLCNRSAFSIRRDAVHTVSRSPRTRSGQGATGPRGCRWHVSRSENNKECRR